MIDPLPMRTTYRHHTIYYHDQLELETLLEEVFKEHTYYVDLDTNTPIIIDAGAHIGTTSIYLHALYPQAELVCIEPHPLNLSYLDQNLKSNGIEKVTVIPKALVGKNGQPEVSLYSNNRFTVFSSLKKGGWNGNEGGEAMTVKTIKLSQVLQDITRNGRMVDVIKMDIEGMETEVIEEIRTYLSKIKHFLIEFHETKNHRTDRLLRLLSPSFPMIKVTKDQRKRRRTDQQLLLIEASK